MSSVGPPLDTKTPLSWGFHSPQVTAPASSSCREPPGPACLFINAEREAESKEGHATIGAELVENLLSSLDRNPLPEAGSGECGSALAKLLVVWQAPGHSPQALGH